MAITTAMCNSFKQELLGGTHDLDTDSIKLALIKATPTGTYNASTTNYSDVTGNSDEASGTGYSAGGQVLDGAAISLDSSTAIVDFTDEVFSNVTVSADGCIIYNASQGNKAIAVIDFGGTVSATAGDLTIEFPAANASNAIIRIA
jgi:DeoR/GlpR family transcriptional regulator of sugar metabolism